MKQRYPLLLGALLILCGIGLFYYGSRRTVEIIVKGEKRTLTTGASRVHDILNRAHIEFTAADQIRPGLNERVKNGGRISLNRAVSVRLDPGNGLSPVTFTSHQRFGGNILLDAGLRLYPGDHLSWKGTELRPDFDLAGLNDLKSFYPVLCSFIVDGKCHIYSSDINLRAVKPSAVYDRVLTHVNCSFRRT